MLVAEDDFEGIVAGLVEGNAGEAHDDVRFYRATRNAFGDSEWPAGLKELASIGVHQADLEIVGPVVGEIGAHPEDEDHSGVSKREFASPDGVEDAEDVQLPFLADVRGVGDDSEIYLQVNGLMAVGHRIEGFGCRSCAVLNQTSCC